MKQRKEGITFIILKMSKLCSEKQLAKVATRRKCRLDVICYRLGDINSIQKWHLSADIW